MFNHCNKLKQIKRIDKFNINKVANINSNESCNNKNENFIICVYNSNIGRNHEINLIYDFDDELSENDIYSGDKEGIKLISEVEKNNKKFLEENIELDIEGERIKFKNKVNIQTKIKVKFKFKKNLKHLSFLFCNNCFLESINFSSFNSNDVNDMIYMFHGCINLKSINFSSFNTSIVDNLTCLFKDSFSIKSLDLSSFIIHKVKYITCIFQNCKSLEFLDISSFNISNVDLNNFDKKAGPW